MSGIRSVVGGVVAWGSVVSLVACDIEAPCGQDEVERAGLALLGPAATACADEACVLQAHHQGDEAWLERETTGAERQWFFTTTDRELWLLYEGDGDGRARLCLEAYDNGGAIECTSVEPAGDFYRVCGSTNGASMDW